jgi:quercetin dioxygenase-like cupin family protein
MKVKCSETPQQNICAPLAASKTAYLRRFKIDFMKEFPDFMKSEKNRISTKEQNTSDIEGYYYNGADDNQIAFWTCYSDQVSKKHTHDFDEYMVCVCGQYTAYLNGTEYILNPGDELFIPKGTRQWGKCIAGTRTIHAFGGKRIKI